MQEEHQHNVMKSDNKTLQGRTIAHVENNTNVKDVVRKSNM
jgi:hypothetical protein